MNYLFEFSKEDLNVLRKKHASVSKKERLINALNDIERKRSETTDIRNSGPYRFVVDYSGVNARRVTKKSAVPFSYYDLTTDGKSQLMEAIVRQIKATVSEVHIFYDINGNPARLESKNRIYCTVDDHSETYGLLVCIDMNSGDWRTNLKRIVGDYTKRYAGRFKPCVITVIKLESKRAFKDRDILEKKVRSLLNEIGISNSYCPVIFWEADKNSISNQEHENDRSSESVVKIIEEMDRCFETPKWK